MKFTDAQWREMHAIYLAEDLTIWDLHCEFLVSVQTITRHFHRLDLPVRGNKDRRAPNNLAGPQATPRGPSTGTGVHRVLPRDVRGHRRRH